jgi:hypothetical protein
MTALSSILVAVAATAMILVMLTPGLGDPAPARACLTKDQQRAAIASGQAVKLAVAIRAARAHAGEVIGARLCHGARGLEYVLTLLARDGKVTHAVIDARNGTLISRR